MNQYVKFDQQDHRPWQPIEYETIKRMSAEGRSDTEIGIVLGRDRTAVLSARKRRNIRSVNPQRIWTDAEAKIVEEMFMAGSSDIAIGEAIGRSRKSVASKRQLLGLDGEMKVDRRKVEAPVRVRKLPAMLAPRLFDQRPCPIDAEYQERVHANAAYLIAAHRAGHPVYPFEALPAIYRVRGEA